MKFSKEYITEIYLGRADWAVPRDKLFTTFWYQKFDPPDPVSCDFNPLKMPTSLKKF